ncbi:hypothetical protein NFI96_006253, partial [Prochilodus magdalenae]
MLSGITKFSTAGHGDKTRVRRNGERQTRRRDRDSSRIAFIVSLLKGEALDWANAVWSTYERGTYTDFIRDFRAVFDHPDKGRETGDQLFQLQQGSRSVAQYALAFRTVAAGSGWNKMALRTAYRNGLNLDIRKELAYQVDGLSLEELIALTIRLDQLKQGSTPASRRPTAARAVPLPLPAAPETRPPPDRRLDSPQRSLCRYQHWPPVRAVSELV